MGLGLKFSKHGGGPRHKRRGVGVWTNAARGQIEGG